MPQWTTPISLAGQTTDFIDKNIGSVNELTDRAKAVTDALPDILKALETAEKHAATLSTR